ncbi:hypothetical protein ACFL0Z_00785 [Patescibacteria group bacterium]
MDQRNVAEVIDGLPGNVQKDAVELVRLRNQSLMPGLIKNLNKNEQARFIQLQEELQPYTDDILAAVGRGSTFWQNKSKANSEEDKVFIALLTAFRTWL